MDAVQLVSCALFGPRLQEVVGIVPVVENGIDGFRLTIVGGIADDFRALVGDFISSARG